MMRDGIKEFLLLLLAMCIVSVAIVSVFVAIWYWSKVIVWFITGEMT